MTMTMNMNQLSNTFQHNLHGEVLAELVGSCDMQQVSPVWRQVLDTKYQSVMRMPRIQQVAEPYNIECGHPVAFVKLSNGRKISVWQDADNSSAIKYSFTRPHPSTFLYNYGIIYRHVVPPENSVALPPFEKHSYPSYKKPAF